MVASERENLHSLSTEIIQMRAVNWKMLLFEAAGDEKEVQLQWWLLITLFK